MRVSTSLDDKYYISEYLNGNQAAFEALLSKHQSKLFGFIFSKVRNESLANDIFQDTFIKIIKTLQAGKYKEEGKFLPWATRIAHNLVMDHFRNQKKMTLMRSTDEYDVFDFIPGHEESKENQLIKHQIFSDIKDLVDLLPESQRQILNKRIFKEMSFQEIANQEDISINTALGRMRYALINLRKLIAKHEINLEC
ncbi:MAG: RNA polymerase sigma factor [Flavobacteriales bacterium]